MGQGARRAGGPSLECFVDPKPELQGWTPRFGCWVENSMRRANLGRTATYTTLCIQQIQTSACLCHASSTQGITKRNLYLSAGKASGCFKGLLKANYVIRHSTFPIRDIFEIHGGSDESWRCPFLRPTLSSATHVFSQGPLLTDYDLFRTTQNTFKA